jgi:lipoprotein-releasing system permease protein
VTGATAERRGFGLIYADGGRSGVTIRSVPQEWWSEDARVRDLVELRSGNFDVTDGESIVVGTEIAARLGVAVGDEVRMLTVRPVGEGRVLPRVSRFTVAGIMSTGYRDLDRLWAFVSLERGRRIIPDETATELIGVKVEFPRSLPNPLFGRGLSRFALTDETEAMVATTEAIMTRLDDEWFVYDWYLAEQGRYVSFLTSRNLLIVVMAMIVLVAVVNISSALVLLVVEKEQEIAILRATGVSSRSIAAVFVVAGLLIGFVGGVLGVAVGLAAAVNINTILQGIETIASLASSRAVDLFNPEFYLESIPIDLQFLPAAGAMALVLLLSFLAAIIPARRAARVAPDRILRRGNGWSRSSNVIH